MFKRRLLIIGSLLLLGVFVTEVFSFQPLLAAVHTKDQQTSKVKERMQKKKTSASTSHSEPMTSISKQKDKIAVQPVKTTSTQENTTIDQTGKSVAITFDDGPNPTTTPQLLQLLKEKKVHATFFVLGENTAQYPQLVKQEVMEGNEIGNHTYDHQNLATLSPAAISEEITKADTEIKKATGKVPAYVRPPYGSVTAVGAGIIQRPIIEWSVDSEDWKTRNADLILQKVQNTVYDGAILLFHDIHPETIAAMPQVIDYLQSQGYALVTVSELLDQPTAAENYYGRNDHRPVQ
ncbi:MULTISPECIES: polysaccharide deacetylase family protein [unclassified Enterococcus]|uniref:polysaccharide deacetylase family protein n=1 Tax=unclassified Enterococcus TaxID=2608891 RepID=UPI0013EC6528|nr:MULTISPECIES: polysaccharide deacetylase family protein [unclassified Enterococcus]